MEHFYETIEGWFDFQNIYTEQVQRAPQNGAVFVEVGCYMGKSTAFMATEIINSGKNITFITVDTFQGETRKKQIDLNLYRTFQRNIERVKHVVIPIVGFSTVVGTLFADSSLDFVFIDASHVYEDVCDDIHTWLPKIKADGYIGGHDYEGGHPDVCRAVDEIFKGNASRIWCSWMCAPSQIQASR